MTKCLLAIFLPIFVYSSTLFSMQHLGKVPIRDFRSTAKMQVRYFFAKKKALRFSPFVWEKMAQIPYQMSKVSTQTLASQNGKFGAKNLETPSVKHPVPKRAFHRALELDERTADRKATSDLKRRWSTQSTRKLTHILLLGKKRKAYNYCLKMYEQYLAETTTSHKNREIEAQSKLVFLIHNAVALATELIAPLADPNFDDAHVLFHNAYLLSHLKLLPTHNDGYLEPSSMRKIGKQLGDKLPLVAADLLALLMRDKKLQLFKEDPRSALLHLPRNFSQKSKPQLTSLYFHKKGSRIIKNTIKQICLDD